MNNERGETNKKHHIMKKLLLNLLLVLGVVGFSACSVSDNPVDPTPTPGGPSLLEKYYFSIVDATYVDAAMPTPTITSGIGGITMNGQAIAGGSNIVTITTQTEYEKFFVGVKNVNGYWEVAPVAEGNGAANSAVKTDNGYLIPILYSVLFDTNVTILVSAKTKSGEYTKITEFPISFVETKSGDLEINLSFNNEKDIDLHLYTPSGKHIYFGDRGGSVNTSEGIVEFGLDKDSNAGCNIDGLNNENIFIPEILVEDGEYIVQVDMWSNCDRSIATSWAVLARYNKELLNNVVEGYGNPAIGEYPVGAGNRDHTTVMKFTINRSNRAKPAGQFVNWNSFKPYPIDDIASMKVEEESWR